MTGKVLILQWAGSAYDSIGGLLELVAEELAAEGFDVVLFPVGDPDWPTRLGSLLTETAFAFALTMSGIGVDLTLNNRPFWEVAKVPLFNWNCDHPCYFPSRHAIRSAFLLHGYVFPDHARYNVNHLNPNGMALAVHLGIPSRSLFGGAPRRLADRNGRIVFSKSGYDHNEIEANWRRCPAILQEILFASAEELFGAGTADFLQVLQRIGECHGLFLTGNNKLALLLMQELDAYVRYRRGNLVMRSVLRYPVDVFGTGWDHIQWGETSAVCRGAVPWRQAVRHLPSYLGCLSVHPLIDNSLHDRVFFALSAGVPPISDANAFSRQHIAGLQPYAFSFGTEPFTRDAIAQAVDALLSDPTDAMARTDAAWQALSIDFGLRRSVRHIADCATMHLVNQPATACPG